MKWNSRFVAMGLSAFMLASVASGCSKGDKKDSPQGEVKQEESKAGADKYQPVEGKKYEIEFLTVSASAVGEDSYMAKRFNEMFNVKVKPIFIESAKFDEILNVKLAAGEIPDVIPSKGTDKFVSYLDQDLLAEVPKDVMQKYAPAVYKMVERDDPTAWNVCGLNGKNYGIPVIGGQYIYRDAVVWRDDWLKNVGISKLPDTIQEWETALTKFRNEDPDKNGKKDTYGCSVTAFKPVFGAYGVIVTLNDDKSGFEGYWLEKDGKIVNSIIEPGAKEALKLLNKWYKAELLDPEFVTGENKGGYWAVSTDFINSRIGVSSHGNPAHWQRTEKGLISFANERDMKKINPDATYEFANPPLGPDGKTRGITQLPAATGLSYVFSKKVEPDKLGKILQMFNWSAEDSKNWIENWIGVEGTHYEITETDGFKVYANIPPYKDETAKRNLEAGTASLFFIQDVENTKKVLPAFFKYFSDYGFDKYGVKDLKSQLYIPSTAKYSTDLKKMATEAYVNIITGSKPIEYFDEFVEKWKKNGGEQMIKEANEHYQKTKAK